jgi:hypothetical protein
MATNSSDYRNLMMQRLVALPIRHRAAFAALCAERQYGTYVHASRHDSRLRPGVLKKAIDRCWAFVRGEEVSTNKMAELKEAVDGLIPNLNEDRSGFASLILDATGAVSYLLGVCLTGRAEDAECAAECARNAVDEWVIGIIAPLSEGLPASIISVAPQDIPRLQAAVEAHPMMMREMQQQEDSLTYLDTHESLGPDEVDHLRNSWLNGNKSNIDLE